MGDGRTQLEMLIVPKKVGAEEIRRARETAQGLVDRARKGEDFADLVRDYSEGPATDKGGVIDRYLQPSEFGPELAPKILAMKPGDVTDPVQDGSRFLVMKLIERADPAKTPSTPAGGVKVAQLVIRVRPNEDALRDQFKEISKLRQKATTAGLGRAAAEAGLATNTSEYYDLNSVPQVLYNCPEAADWGTTAKKGEVSPLFEGLEEFVVVEVRVQQAPGLVPKDLIGETLRQLAEMDARVARSQPRADALAKALASGRTLEQAAATVLVTPFKIDGTTRRQPDTRIAPAPEFVGALFAASPGRTVGPIQGVNGWYFGRLEHLAPGDTALFRQVSEQLRNETMQRRQQSLFTQYITALRQKSKIEDLRTVSY
jgi:parvulin-like peptidyl-prolyl isomerase